MKEIPYYFVSVLPLFLLISRLYSGEGEIPKSRFSLCLVMDKACYSPGDAIEMKLKVSNHSSEEAILRFKDGQRYDFIIETDGEIVWRWSKGRVFAQVLGEKRLGPRESITYIARFEGKLNPGTCTVRGMIVSRPTSLVASSVISVKESNGGVIQPSQRCLCLRNIQNAETFSTDW